MRKLGGAERAPRLAVAMLVRAHLRDDCEAAAVFRGQSIEMPLEVALDLRFGLGEESEAPSVSRGSRYHAPRVGSRLPKGIEQAVPRIDLLHVATAPGEMIAFLACRGL